MGADPSGIAMGALTVCAAVITDDIQIQVKRHDARWRESARIWTALVGPPSTKKSPIINEASMPLKKIDKVLARQYMQELIKHQALTAEERRSTPLPKQERLRIEDTTVEAMQEVLKDSPNGVLCLQDELGGWFGSMDKYASGKGASKDRAVWLQAFNGGSYAINRIGRGVSVIDNLSVCLLGGIQPDPIRKIASEASDDGLLQRLFPIILAPASLGCDEVMPAVSDAYDRLVNRLHNLSTSDVGNFGEGASGRGALSFDDDAQSIRREMEELHMQWQSVEIVNPKLSAHIGKYDGLFARLCLLFHTIDNADLGHIPDVVTARTAHRVSRFMHEFLLPHAVSFFAGVLGFSDEQDRLSAIAGFILAHGLSQITFRDIQRGDRIMRGMDREEARRLMEQMESLGWLEQRDGPRPSSEPQWRVNPQCHVLYALKATTEHDRREAAKQRIRDLYTHKPGQK